MIVSRLLLSPADEHPVHCIRRPVFHRNPGHIKDGYIPDGLHGELRDLLLAESRSLFLFSVSSDLFENELGKTFLRGLPLHQLEALLEDIV